MENNEIELNDAQRGKYDVCIKNLMRQGYSKREAESACAKWLQDGDMDDEEFNVMFTDARKKGESGEACIKRKIPIFAKEHPDWEHKRVVAAAHGYCGLSKKQDAIELSNVIERSKSLSLSRFSTLIKAIKTRAGLKVGAMGILPQNVSLPMKNLNRLQTKMEKQVTEESKNLTMEQYEQRKQYARYMRKEDAENLPDLSDQEFVDELAVVYDAILEYYPNLEPEEAIDRAFELPQGDNAWIISDEAEIVSMNDSLNNVIKAPIILAKEMIQHYDVMDDDTGDTKREYHFKPFEELRDAAIRAQANGPLDIIIEHQDWYDTDNVIGYVKQIRAHEKSRTIRGMGYFLESKLPIGLKQMISDGEIVSVSIGFLAKLGEAGEWQGKIYDHVQTNINLRHLAICLDSVPRCPAGVCGVNLKDAENDKTKFYIIKKEDNYYYNICKLFNDSKKETNTKPDIEKNLSEIETMQTDSENGGKIAGDEPDDLEAILTRLRKLINDEGWAAEVKGNAITRILAALGIKQKSDSEMDEKEFQDAINLKKSEIEDLKLKLEDASSKIKQFEEKERQNYIKVIKKFGDKYSDEELQKEDLQSLEKIADAVSRFAPSTKEPEVLPVAAKGDKEEMEDNLEKGKRIDFSKVFDDVKKEFNMSGL